MECLTSNFEPLEMSSHVLFAVEAVDPKSIAETAKFIPKAKVIFSVLTVVLGGPFCTGREPHPSPHFHRVQAMPQTTKARMPVHHQFEAVFGPKFGVSFTGPNPIAIRGMKEDASQFYGCARETS